MRARPIEVGHPAPAFAAPDQDGTVVSLHDLAGSWVVLYFYPKDDTPGCTTEACELTAKVPELGNLDALVLGCSPDPPARHRAFIARHNLKVRLLSDPDHAVMEAYGAWGEKRIAGKTTQGVIRSTVLIDPRGRVAFHWPKVRARGHAEAVHAKLVELRA